MVYTLRQFILLLFLSTATCAFAEASLYLDNLPNKKPKQILTDNTDRFYIDYNSKIYIYHRELESVLRIRDPKKNYSSYLFDTKVTPTGDIYSLTISQYRPKKSKTTNYRLAIAKCDKSNCTFKNLGGWHSGEKSPSYSASKLKISKQGNVFFSVDYTFLSGKKWKTNTTYYINSKKTTKDTYKSSLTRDFKTTASVNFGGSQSSSKSEIAFYKGGKKLTYKKARKSRYTLSSLYDNNDLPHIFFHNPVDRSFYHHFYSPHEGQVKEVIVDSAESGWENLVFSNKDELWTVYYFYRDSFNKGLQVVRSDSQTGDIVDRFLIDASDVRNSGWELSGAQSSENRILMTYLSDTNNNIREFVLLDDVADLKNILGENFKNYGHPKGSGYLPKQDAQSMNNYIATLNSSHRSSYRSNYLNAGTGIQYVNWSARSGEPDDDSNVATPYDVDYELNASVLSIASLEGKFGSTNFGLKFAKEVAGKEVKENVKDESGYLSKISGRIGWDKLFFNYDFSFQYEKSSSTVIFTDNSGQVPSKNFTLDYSEMKFSLLNIKRHHFGYIYQEYNFYQPVYIYSIGKDAKAYQFFGQAIGSVEANNHLFHYGYSTLDYLTKYETGIRQWFFDGEIRLGFSRASFQDDTASTTDLSPSKEWEFLIATQLEVGYIWYKRWKRFAKMGGAVKLSYRVDFSHIGSADKPDDLEEASSKQDFTYSYERTEIRHGPLIYFSLNY